MGKLTPEDLYRNRVGVELLCVSLVGACEA